MDTGVWWAAIHGVAKSWTHLSMHACMHERVKEASHVSILRKSVASRGKNKSKVTNQRLCSRNRRPEWQGVKIMVGKTIGDKIKEVPMGQIN